MNDAHFYEMQCKCGSQTPGVLHRASPEPRRVWPRQASVRVNTLATGRTEPRPHFQPSASFFTRRSSRSTKSLRHRRCQSPASLVAPPSPQPPRSTPIVPPQPPCQLEALGKASAPRAASPEFATAPRRRGRDISDQL